MKSYEELLGAEGRRIFYRAERFRARELFPRLPPRVVIDGNSYDLEDLSITGLAARGRLEDAGPERLNGPVEVELAGENGTLFRGKGRLCRVETDGPRTRVALSFLGAPLDIPELVTRHRQALIRREFNGGLHHALEAVSPEYRRHCVDVVHLLRRYRAALERFAPPGPDGDGSGAPAPGWRDEEVYALAEERLLPEWRELWHAGNALVRPLMSEPEPLRAVKEFTELVATPEFMAGPIWKRSYEKPLGYPGDFEMMNYVYEWRPRGETVFERLVHRIGLDVAECIGTRMVMIQRALAEMMARGPADRPARVLSLGCGPAQEVANYMQVPSLPRPIDVTLMDQDHEALSYAYRQICPDAMRFGNRSTVQCLQVSFIQLMKDTEVFEFLPPQELIYSVGLVDYLSMKRVQRLVRRLYDKLAPGGQLVIGNMADVAGGNLWPMEFLCDWSLHYRNEDAMIEMAAEVPGGAERTLRPDPTGRVHMLYLQRPDESSAAA